MLRQWRVAFSVMLTHEAATAAEAQLHESCITYDHALKSQQLVFIKRMATSVADDTSPPLPPVARGLLSLYGIARAGVFEEVNAL